MGEICKELRGLDKRGVVGSLAVRGQRGACFSRPVKYLIVRSGMVEEEYSP